MLNFAATADLMFWGIEIIDSAANSQFSILNSPFEICVGRSG
jgi:hypothetical protein